MSDPSPGCRELVSYRYLREKCSQNVVMRVSRLINIRVRIAKCHSRLYFNHRCIENKVLLFKPPVRSVKGYKLIENTGFSFLRLRIDQCHHSIRCLLSLFSRSPSELSAWFDPQFWNVMGLRDVLFERTTRVFQTVWKTWQEVAQFVKQVVSWFFRFKLER